MYSALVFGCPNTTIRPESRDVETDRNHICGDGDVDAALVLKGRDKPAFGIRHLGRVHAARQFHRFVVDLPVLKESLRFTNSLAGGIARETVADFVLDQSARAAKLSQAVEIAEQRHVWIGGIRRLAFLLQTRVATSMRPQATPGRRAACTTLGLRP